MRIIEPHAPAKPPKRKKRGFAVAAVVVIVLGLAVNCLRPLPGVQVATAAGRTIPAQTVPLAWPGFGEAAVMTPEDGLLGTSGPQTPLATASTAKIIAALCILQKHPLNPGDKGPVVTMTARDVELYDQYLAKDGSVAAVAVGEHISEYQMLQGMLLQSANNLADTAAIWAYGSMDNYLAAANAFVRQQGMLQTTVAVDASGFDPSTVSTASDLAKLGLAALQEPVLMEIAGQTQATIPVEGKITNYNLLLGQNGIIGLKTGNNDADLGAYLFVANIPVGQARQTIVGSVMGAGSLRQAMLSSLPLISSVEAGFDTVSVIPQGAAAVTYRSPWQSTAVQAITGRELLLTHWKGSAIQEEYETQAVTTGAHKGTLAGYAIARSGSRSSKVKLVLAADLPKPGFMWRLARH